MTSSHSLQLSEHGDPDEASAVTALSAPRDGFCRATVVLAGRFETATQAAPIALTYPLCRVPTSLTHLDRYQAATPTVAGAFLTPSGTND